MQEPQHRVRCLGVTAIAYEFRRIDQWQIVNKNLDEYRFVPEYQSIESVLVFVNGDMKEANQKPISLRTLYNAEKRVRTRQQKLIDQGRKEQARNEFGSRAGKLPDADFPLAVVQIDHTTVQIIFVDEDERKPLTDAWLTLVIDCFSRMVLGYYLTFEEPTAMAAGIALARSFLPKDEHLKEIVHRRDKLTAEIEKAEARVHAIKLDGDLPMAYSEWEAGDGPNALDGLES